MPDEARTPQPEPDDATLLKAIAKGKEAPAEAAAAAVVFCDRWYPQFALIATRLTGNRPDGEDIAQGAIVQVLTKARTYKPSRPARAWLMAVLYNRVRDWARRNNVRWALSVNDTDDGAPEAVIPDDAPTAAEVVEAKERSGAVQAALMKLTAMEREVILLRDFQGLSPEEAAQVLDISVPMVGSRLHRARKRLGGLLQADWPSLFPPREL